MSKYVIISFLFFFIIRVLISVAIGAEVNLYSAPILLARSGPESTYNLPKNFNLQNVTPQINDRLDVAFKVYLSASLDEQAVWLISNRIDNHFDLTRGQLVAQAPEGYAVSDIDLNNKGEMVFSFFNDEGSEGLYFYNDITKAKKVLEGSALDLKYFSSVKINDESQIYFKGIKNNDKASEIFTFDVKKNTAPISLIAEGSGISYLFTLGLLDEDDGLVFKMRMGQLDQVEDSRPDQIVRINNGGLNVIAVDRDTQIDSPYISFYNSVVPGPGQTTVFLAQTDNGVGLFFHHPQQGITPLVYEGQHDIGSLQLFAPVVRQHENIFEVFFRGKNTLGEEVIYFLQHDLVTGGNIVKSLLVQNQKISTDVGELPIILFSGGLGLSNLGDLVVHTIFKANQEGIVLLNRLQE
jgi:hypothetical protein